MNKAGKKTSFAKEKDKTKQEDEPLNSEGVHAILSAYKDRRLPDRRSTGPQTRELLHKQNNKVR